MKATMISEFVTEGCAAAVMGEEYTLADVCEISDKILHMMHPDMRHEKLNGEGTMSTYHEKSQELFNSYLDEVGEALEEIGLVYNSFNSRWSIPRPAKGLIQIAFPFADRDVFVYELGSTTPIEALLEEFKNSITDDYSLEELEHFLSRRGFEVVSVLRVGAM